MLDQEVYGFGTVHFHYVFISSRSTTGLFRSISVFCYLFYVHFVELPFSLSFCSAHDPFSFQLRFYSPVPSQSIFYSFRLCPFWFHSVPSDDVLFPHHLLSISVHIVPFRLFPFSPRFRSVPVRFVRF